MSIPKVTLKIATTLDGKISTKTGESKWITGEKSRKLVHQLRNEFDAILVGINTVLIDNPKLNTRGIAGGRSPVRVILDSNARIPLESSCLNDDGVTRIVIVGQNAPLEKLFKLKNKNIEILQSPTSRPEISWVVSQLSKYKIKSLLVEGGSHVHASFIRDHIADHLLLFMAGKIIGGEKAPSWCAEMGIESLSDAPCLKLDRTEFIGEDILIHANFK